MATRRGHAAIRRGIALVLLAGTGLTAAPVLSSPALAVPPASSNAGFCGESPTSLVPVPDPPAVTTVSTQRSFTLSVQGDALFQQADQRTVVISDRNSGSVIKSVPLGSRSAIRIVADPQGGFYTASYPYTLVKWDSTGTQLWTRTVSEEIFDFSPVWVGGKWGVGLTTRRNAPITHIFSSDGVDAGPGDIVGADGTRSRDGGTVTTDGHYAYRWTPDGHLAQRFGSAGMDNTTRSGGSLSFYLQGGAVQLSDGRFLVADNPRGIILTDAEGNPQGLVKSQDLGGLRSRSPLYVGDDGSLYFLNDAGTAKVAVAGLLAAVGHMPGNPSLGYGAGLMTGHVDNYVPVGEAASITASFDPWWQVNAGKYTLRTSTRTWRDQLSGAPGQVQTIPLDAATLAAGVSWPFPTTPGPTDVDARLLTVDGSTLSATCLHIGRGAAGNLLDFSTLPAGAGYGGPGPARQIALADVLGTGLARETVNWTRLLKNGSTGPLDFSYLDDALATVPQESSARGVTFDLQMGQGYPERGLVDDGTWAARVGEVVSHFKDRVHVWEAWNEPNNNFGNGTDYVNKILKPFYQAVKAVDPSATVVGGSVLGVAPAWYYEMAKAGGLDYMDVASVHPYTGHNRGLEEEGTLSGIAAMKHVLETFGHADMPVWNTESAWWGDGPYSEISQADDSVHARLWFAQAGISKWAYFLAEGGYGDFGLSYSAIQIDDAVKPAALALMATRTQLRGRTFRGQLTTGVPNTYAFRFGPTSGGQGGDLVAVFTDRASTRVALKTTGADRVGVVDQYGRRQAASGLSQGRTLTATSAVQWFELPAGAAATIGPAESYGTNLAVAGTASATSSGPNNGPGKAIDGFDGANNGGDFPNMPVWASGVGDDNPSLTVHLAQPATVDRVLVSTHSLGSVEPGLRDYTVQVRASDIADWETVGQIVGQFYERTRSVSFAARTASDVRITVTAVNYSGLAGGQRPSVWPTDHAMLTRPNDPWYGPAIVSELRVYAPGTVAAVPDLTLDSGPAGESRVALNPLPSLINAGSPVTFSGQVRRTTSGSAWGMLTINAVLDNGASVVVARLTPAADGSFKRAISPSQNATYTAAYRGDAGNIASTPSAGRRTLAAVSISVQAARRSVATAPLAVRGTVGPNKRGQVVMLYRVVAGGKLQAIGRTGLTTGSTYAMRVRLPRGSYTLQLSMGATPGNSGRSVRFPVTRT